jgi:hypothetical protein
MKSIWVGKFAYPSRPRQAIAAALAESAPATSFRRQVRPVALGGAAEPAHAIARVLCVRDFWHD